MKFSLLFLILLSGCTYKSSTKEQVSVKRIPSAMPSPVKGAWRSFRNGFQNRAVHSLAVKKLVEDSVYRKVSAFEAGGLFWGTAVVDDQDNAYVGSTNKFVYSFNSQGKLRWKYQIYDRADSLIDSAAVLAPNNLVVVPGGDGFLHALNRDTGEQVWDFKAHGTSDEGHQEGSTVNSFEGNVQLGPNGVIYAGNDNGYMYAVDLNGKELWNFKTNMMIWSSPAFDPKGEWMAFGSLDGHLYVLNPETGAVIDQVKIGYDVKSSPTIDEQGNIYFGASNFIFYSYKLVDQKLVKNWEYAGAHGELYSSAALKSGNIVFGSLEGGFYNVSAETGKLNWRFMTYSPVASSPMITSDNVVLFGAKNGKLYALDLMTGERIWSYKTSDVLQKSNLDASVSLNSNGMIINGSYRGIVHQIPYEYCLQHKSDDKCEFGDKNDSPDFGHSLVADESTLIYFNSQGKFEQTPKAKIGLTEMLKLQLVSLKEGVWEIDRAISTTSVKVRITPHVDLRVETSSDGQILNILPLEAFKPNQEYKMEVTGSHYHQTNWFKDRLAFFGHRKFSTSLKFTTVDNTSFDRRFLTEGALGIRAMYLQQPQALDTYTPAALDGQGFLAKPFGFNEKDGSFLLYVVAAFPREGDMLVSPEPSKVFTMKGFLDGNNLRTEGRVKLSAMGGTIDFNFMTVRGKIPDFESMVRNTFYCQTSCLSIKGNGSSYQFPMKLVNRICGPTLKLKAIGEMDMYHYTKKTTPQMFPKVVEKSHSNKEGNLTIKVSSPLVDTIISLVVYEKESGKIIQHTTKIAKKSEESAIEFGKVTLSKGQSLAVFSNQEIIMEDESNE